MYAKSPEFEVQGTIFKFKKRNKISSLLVYIHLKTRNWSFSRRSRAKTAKKCTKKGDVRAKLLFCALNPLFILDVLVAFTSLNLTDPNIFACNASLIINELSLVRDLLLNDKKSQLRIKQISLPLHLIK